MGENKVLVFKMKEENKTTTKKILDTVVISSLTSLIASIVGGVAFYVYSQATTATEDIKEIKLQLKVIKEDKDFLVFDVIKEGEFLSEHVLNAKHTPLDYLNNHLTEFPSQKKVYVHCAGGYRSMIAASILKSRGIHNLIDIAGGFEAIKKSKGGTTK